MPAFYVLRVLLYPREDKPQVASFFSMEPYFGAAPPATGYDRSRLQTTGYAEVRFRARDFAFTLAGVRLIVGWRGTIHPAGVAVPC